MTCNCDDGCDECEPDPVEMARMYELYKAEKAAGLLRPQEEIDADLRNAGRGHLVRQ